MSVQAANLLEEKLAIAVEEPLARPDFYNELRNAFIYTIQGGDHPIEERSELQPGQAVELVNLEYEGRRYVPIFSSLERMQDFIVEPVQYLTIHALHFFLLTRGADVLLNPGSPFGKELNAHEIESIIDGSALMGDDSFIVDQETDMMIGKPPVPPAELLGELSQLFDSLKNVICAYNAHVFNPRGDASPHTLIAVSYVGKGDKIIAEAGKVVEGLDIPYGPVRFVELNGNSGLEGFFENKCKPFYLKETF